MHTYVYWYYFFLIPSIQSTEISNSYTQKTFYTDIEKLRGEAFVIFKNIEIQVKNDFIQLIEKEHELKKVKKKFQKLFPSYQKNNEQLLHDKLNSFLESHTTNIAGLDYHIERINKNFKQACNEIYISIKNKALELFNENEIDKETYLKRIQKITFRGSFFFIILDNFERIMLSRSLKVDAFKTINPIHELLYVGTNNTRSHNYIDVLLEILELYDLPSSLEQFLNELKGMNKAILTNEDLLTIIKQSLNSLCKATDKITVLDYYKKVQNITDDMFLEDSLLIKKFPEIKKDSNLNSLTPFIDEINIHFRNFCKKYIELKAQVNSVIKNHGKNTNKIIDEQEKNSIKNRLIKFFYENLECNQEFFFNIRLQLNALITIIRGKKTDIDINEKQMFAFHKERNEAYNSILKTQFEHFFTEVINTATNNIFSDFNKFGNIENQTTIENEIAAFNEKLNGSYNHKRKKDVIAQITTLFTDQKIKNECLKNLKKIIITYLDLIEEKSKTKLSPIGENKYSFSESLQVDLDKFITTEKEFALSVRGWIESEIYNIDSLTKNINASNNNNSQNSIQEEKNMQNNDKKTNWTMLISFSILIAVFIGGGIFIILRFKKNKIF